MGFDGETFLLKVRKSVLFYIFNNFEINWKICFILPSSYINVLYVKYYNRQK